jgi:hypothetical protein
MEFLTNPVKTKKMPEYFYYPNSGVPLWKK